MAISEVQHRNRLGRFILISNLVFGGLIVIFYLLRGFDGDEFVDLLKLIAPIKSVYLTALIRYVVANKNVIEKSVNGNTINPLYANTSYLIIVVHITSLIIATALYALFNAMDFDVLKNIIIGVETFFGVYVGLFMASMFKVEEEEEEEQNKEH